MKLFHTFILLLCLALPFLLGADQTEETLGCVAQKADGWPLPWSGIKYSVSKRSVLMYNDKPTELSRQLLILPREIAIPVPGCEGTHLLKTNRIARLDFQGQVFAYLISGARVRRDETGHLRDLGSVAVAMWYDDTGDGRFRKVIDTPALPPAIPAWVHGANGVPK